MNLRSQLHRLLGSAGTEQAGADARGAEETAEAEAGQKVKYVGLPGDADWEDAAALVVAEDGTEHRFPLPDEVADPTRSVRIQFGGSSDDPNTLVWDDPPAVTSRADFLIEDADGTVQPIPETERRSG